MTVVKEDDDFYWFVKNQCHKMSAGHTDCLKTAFGRPRGPPASSQLLLVLPTCAQQE